MGIRDGGDNLDLTWKRRNRLNAEWLDLVDVPLNEETEEYEIDIVDNPAPGAGAVIKTVTGLTSEAYEYPIAEQQADFAHDADFPLDIVSRVVNSGFENDGAVAAAVDPEITGWETTSNPAASCRNRGLPSAA